jgi:hypothetical protein
MSGTKHKRIGRLLWNWDILMYDVLFQDGTNFGGLQEGQELEALNKKGVWLSACLRCDGESWYLQGVNGYFVPLGIFVRI